MEHKAALQLPLAVVSPVDVGRLSRELTALDEFLSQAALRGGGQAPALPQTSKLLEELARQNQLDLLVATERRRLTEFLASLTSRTPVLHFSFAADPSPAFLQKIVAWLRREVHPSALVVVGLQPSIAAGCVLRSSSKYFDFSLRQHFIEKRGLLVERIGSQT
ncbi:MAG TPA: hypothetical protein VK963_04340 [Candidatus Saccharimonadales bacterium]|nr:hypothetical protein [Candidatus Saccharimonadales bacterium]